MAPPTRPCGASGTAPVSMALPSSPMAGCTRCGITVGIWPTTALAWLLLATGSTGPNPPIIPFTPPRSIGARLATPLCSKTARPSSYGTRARARSTTANPAMASRGMSIRVRRCWKARGARGTRPASARRLSSNSAPTIIGCGIRTSIRRALAMLSRQMASRGRNSSHRC